MKNIFESNPKEVSTSNHIERKHKLFELIDFNRNGIVPELIDVANSYNNVVAIDTNSHLRTMLSTNFFDRKILQPNGNLDKYIDYTEGIETEHIGDFYLFDTLDKYLMNFLEESSELNAAYNKLINSIINTNSIDKDTNLMQIIIKQSDVFTDEYKAKVFAKDGVLDELCDIVIYADIINTIIKVFMNKTLSVDTINIPHEVIISEDPLNFSDNLLKLNEIIIEIRRLFSVRKWHKPHNQNKELQLKITLCSFKLIREVSEFVINFGTRLIKHSDPLIDNEESVKLLNEIIESKRKMIAKNIKSNPTFISKDGIIQW